MGCGVVAWWSVPRSHNPEAVSLSPACLWKGIWCKTDAKSSMRVCLLWQPHAEGRNADCGMNKSKTDEDFFFFSWMKRWNRKNETVKVS